MPYLWKRVAASAFYYSRMATGRGMYFRSPKRRYYWRTIEERVAIKKRRRMRNGILAIMGTDPTGFGVTGVVVSPIGVPTQNEVVLNQAWYSGDPYEDPNWAAWDPNFPAPDPNFVVPGGWVFGEWPQPVRSGGGGSPFLAP